MDQEEIAALWLRRLWAKTTGAWCIKADLLHNSHVYVIAQSKVACKSGCMLGPEETAVLWLLCLWARTAGAKYYSCSGLQLICICARTIAHCMLSVPGTAVLWLLYI